MSAYADYIERNRDQDTTEQDILQLRKEYIKETAGYIVSAALCGLDHGGNLLLDRVIKRLREVHGCNVTYDEAREGFRKLASSIEYGIEWVEGF